MHLRVPSGKGEQLKKELISLGAFDRSRRILERDGFVYIPVTKEVDIKGAERSDIAGEPQDKRNLSLHEALRGKLSDEELGLVPRSFDVIGDIAVIEIPDELSGKEKIIGEALLATFRNIKTVASKKTSVGTEYRVRDVEVIAGENKTETVHREHGCIYKLDVTKAYFSPRLGSERLRVADQVNEGERVLVMFAGIGPYAILIAKKKKPSEVVAIELNPDAVRYMEENIRQNKVKVKAVLGDAGEETKRLGKFDRIIMPLPKDAGDFLESALPALNKGGVTHFYTFAETTKEAENEVKKLCSALGYNIKVLSSVECGTYSPNLSRMCVDFSVL